MSAHRMYARPKVEQRYKDAQIALFKSVVVPFTVMGVFGVIFGVTLVSFIAMEPEGTLATVTAVVGLLGGVAIFGMLVWFFIALLKGVKASKSMFPVCPACEKTIDANGRGKLMKTAACPHCKQVILSG